MIPQAFHAQTIFLIASRCFPLAMRGYIFSCLRQKKPRLPPVPPAPMIAYFISQNSPFLKESAPHILRSRLDHYIFFAQMSSRQHLSQYGFVLAVHLTSMVHKAMAEITSFFRWNDLPQGHFHLLWFFDSIHKPDSITKPDAMRICNNCRFAKNISHDQIGTLASYAGKFQKCLESCRDVVIILFMKDSHTCTDVPALLLPSPTRPDDLLNLLRLCSRQRCHIRILRIKSPLTIELTLASVHCAARRTLTSSFHA